MQALIGLAVSDAALLRAFADAHKRVLDVTASWSAVPTGIGMWGIGFHAHGEMLVRKGPLRGHVPGAMAGHLKDVRARHVVLVAEVHDTSRKLEDCSPLRYRDWLFAATGAHTLGAQFAERVQAELPTYAFATKRHPTPDEAVMMLVMSALERANARDTRDLTTRAIQRALGTAAERLRGLADDISKVELLVTLHVNGHLFVFAIGRPIWVARFRGTGDVVRPGRFTRNEHLRALVIGDKTNEEVAWEQLPPGLGAEVDIACDLFQFPA